MRFFIIILLISGLNTLSAQSIDFNWPEDRLTAEQKNTAYRIALEEGRYRDAADDLHWLLINSPELSVSIYQNGTKIYEFLALNEANDIKAAMYADSTLLLFDLRLQYYGEEEKVRNLKSYSSFKMFNNNKEQALFLLQEYDSLYSQITVSSFNIIPYAYVVRNYQKVNGDLTLTATMDRYISIQNVLIDLYGSIQNASTGKEVYAKIKVDDIFFELLDANCDFILKETLEVWKGREDVKLAKVLFNRLNEYECNTGPLFLDLAETINEESPQVSLTYSVLAKGYQELGDFEKAGNYLQESLELTSEKEVQAKILVEMADNSLKLNNREQALDFLKRSLEIGPSQMAFNSLGNLYYSSVEECGGSNFRFVYILAYESYIKAENEKMMILCSEQFPSREELFQQNLKVGEIVQVDCWGMEEVKLQARD